LIENRQGRLIGKERIRQEAIIKDDEEGVRARVPNKGAKQGTKQGCIIRYKTRVQRLVQEEVNYLGTNTFDSLVAMCLVLNGHISEN